MRLSRPVLTLFVSLAAAMSSGCSQSAADNLPREAVSGAVTLNGMAVDHGFIQFRQLGPGDGVVTGGEIKGGKYSIPRADGPVPGGYRVIISSTENKGGPPADEMPGVMAAASTELIPAQYNSSSKLDREIKAGGANTIDFDLKK